MFSQKRWIRLGLYIERLHRLAMDIAMQSALRGQDGKGLAIVADECRNVATKLYQMYDETEDADGLAAAFEDILLELETLSVNGCIESFRYETNAIQTKPCGVICDDILNLSADIRFLFRLKPTASSDSFDVMPRNQVLLEKIPFLAMTVGGVVYCEHLRCVDEVVYFTGNNPREPHYCLRGKQIPVVHKLAVSDHPPFLIITNTAYEPEGRRVGVPADRLPNIFWGYAGVSTEKAPLLRECWTCEEDKKMRFLDYARLLD